MDLIRSPDREIDQDGFGVFNCRAHYFAVRTWNDDRSLELISDQRKPAQRLPGPTGHPVEPSSEIDPALANDRSQVSVILPRPEDTRHIRPATQPSTLHFPSFIGAPQRQISGPFTLAAYALTKP